MLAVKTRKSWLRSGAVLALGGSLMLASGCDNAGEGALSGAGLGALGGLAIGSLAGHAGTGAIIGAVAGGLGGAVIGDQNARKNGSN